MHSDQMYNLDRESNDKQASICNILSHICICECDHSVIDNVASRYRHYCDRMLRRLMWNRKQHFLDELMHVREIVTNLHKECGKEIPFVRSYGISRYVVLKLELDLSIDHSIPRPPDFRLQKRYRNSEGRDI